MYTKIFTKTELMEDVSKILLETYQTVIPYSFIKEVASEVCNNLVFDEELYRLILREAQWQARVKIAHAIVDKYLSKEQKEKLMNFKDGDLYLVMFVEDLVKGRLSGWYSRLQEEIKLLEKDLERIENVEEKRRKEKMLIKTKAFLEIVDTLLNKQEQKAEYQINYNLL